MLNLGLIDVNIEATNNAGTLAAYNRGNIIGNYASGKISATGTIIGGLVGEHREGWIANSYAAVDATGETDVGGLAAHNYASIINSYATGTVTGERWSGGLVGILQQNGRIRNSYATGECG